MKTELRFRPTLASKRHRFGIARRTGSVLLLIVVVVGLLTLAAYNFAQSMTTEFEAASVYTQTVQARANADSGLEFAATILGNKQNLAVENLIHNPKLFMGQIVSASPNPRANGRFSLIAPVEIDTRSGAIRYGMMDESAKLNINALPNLGLSHEVITTIMMNVPNMTVEIIDSILDWIDSDDTMKPYGAESDLYQTYSPPYKAKNGPFESIDELLLVKGITAALLYGEDANRNGLLDPNENDGDASPPFDNANGVLDHGFAAYLTVHGREANRGIDGALKINVNDGYLTELFDELVKSFDVDTAKFVIGYRINGPSGTQPVSKTNPPGPSSGGSAKSVQEQQVAEGLQEFLPSVASGPVTREGIDLSKGGKVAIESLWQLIGSETTVTISGREQKIKSPWTSDPAAIMTTYPLLSQKLTTTKDDFLEGRININQARREILMGLPTITEQIVNSIIDAQQLDANGQPSIDKIREHSSTAWLVAEGFVDLPGMVSLDPYITARGDVYKVQVLGFFDGGGPVSRMEAMIDSTQLPPRITIQRDLNDLGRGYSRMQMLSVR